MLLYDGLGLELMHTKITEWLTGLLSSSGPTARMSKLKPGLLLRELNSLDFMG